MKKIIFVLAVLMSYGLTLAQTTEPTYMEANGSSDDVTLTAKVINPLTITSLYVPPVPLPAVIINDERTFTPQLPTGMPHWSDPGDGSFNNGSSGNFGWIFKLTKQAGPENNNSGADPYRVTLKCTVVDPANNIELYGNWYFWEKDNTLPKYENKSATMGEDFTTTWFADEDVAYMAFYLTKINAKHKGTAPNKQVTVGVKNFTINISGYYSAI